MAWKERHAPESAWLARLAVLVGLGLVANITRFQFLSDQTYLGLAFDEMFTHGLDIGPWGAQGVQRTGLNYVLCEQAAILFSASLVASTILAASGVAGERGRGTWAGLLATPLDRRALLRAKIRGAIGPVRVLLGMMLFFYLASMATTSLHPVGFLMVVAGAAAFLWFAVALGTYISIRSKDASRAIGRAVLILAAVNLAPAVALSPWAGFRSTVATTPALMTMLPLSRMQFRNITTNLAIEPSVGLIFLLLIGVILAHAVGAWWLMRASARRMDFEEA